MSLGRHWALDTEASCLVPFLPRSLWCQPLPGIAQRPNSKPPEQRLPQQSLHMRARFEGLQLMGASQQGSRGQFRVNTPSIYTQPLALQVPGHRHTAVTVLQSEVKWPCQ